MVFGSEQVLLRNLGMSSPMRWSGLSTFFWASYQQSVEGDTTDVLVEETMREVGSPSQRCPLHKVLIKSTQTLGGFTRPDLSKTQPATTELGRERFIVTEGAVSVH